ncbi:DUF6907 domain-containing protein [Streptomyces yunnanensis]|uniref:Uncharacterized protein n=1 Tax=Streptomyces yunnanensis TaxID=156453 RepID=A0A9X8MTA0_9ACTN|nr:hypothetical protein [Streptomyces yunnanensis]SHL74523.1 hypothetical protein SAMN05216268_10653 [Streptomyces yunnanensis]
MSTALVAPRASRSVRILVRDAKVTVDCPAWCVEPHTEVYRSLEDVAHRGSEIALSVPVYGGDTVQVLTARIESWPFAGDPQTQNPFFAYNPANDEFAQITPEVMAAAADQVIAHGHALLALAATIAGGAQ